MLSSTFAMLIGLGFANLVMMALAIPMILGWVKPNRWYGFRTPKTLSDERIWYQANAYAGWCLLLAGLVNFVALLGLYLVPPLRADLTLFNLAFLLVCVIGLVSAIVASLRYLNTL